MATASLRGQPRDTASLEKFHASFIDYHGSPERKKFLLQFGMPAALPIVAASPPATTCPARRLPETTSQYQYQSYIGIPASFAPLTKHRVRKAADHELTETMFTLWNVTGHKPF